MRFSGRLWIVLLALAFAVADLAPANATASDRHGCSGADSDGDGFRDGLDNCPTTPNPAQLATDCDCPCFTAADIDTVFSQPECQSDLICGSATPGEFGIESSTMGAVDCQAGFASPPFTQGCRLMSPGMTAQQAISDDERESCRAEVEASQTWTNGSCPTCVAEICTDGIDNDCDNLEDDFDDDCGALGARRIFANGTNTKIVDSQGAETPISGTLILGGTFQQPGGGTEIGLAGPSFLLSGGLVDFCTRVESCTGFLYCAGGQNVDTTVDLDSTTAVCQQDGTNNCANAAGNLCCSNACQVDGNAPVVNQAAGAADSGPGAMELTCVIQTAPLGLATRCQDVDYTGFPMTTRWLTTGTATTTIQDHCAAGGDPTVAPTVSRTGANFDCATWTQGNTPGELVWAGPFEASSPASGPDLVLGVNLNGQ